jgi:hypothetical protein
MKPSAILSLAMVLGACLIGFSIACTKNSNPQPPVTDTVTIVKNDTTVNTDTIYGTKPDPTVNLTQGLLLYLNFTGNIADSSGNGNPTVAVNGPVLTYDTHGYADNAFGATGAGQEVVVTNNGSIQFDTAYSLSFDFMVNQNGQQAYICMVDPTNGEGPTFLVGTTYSGTSNIVWGSEDVSLGCSAYGTNDNINIVDTPNFQPQPGSWYNAICVYHRGSGYFYLNGRLISTKIGIGTAADLCPASQIIIGAWWNGQPLSLNGKMDNVRLYNRVLTPHEIVALSSNYQVTSTSQRPGLRTDHH